MKRAIDLSGALTGLLILGPLMLIIAVAVRLTSPGPALFRQPRLGQNGSTFVLLKFRSMYVDSRDIRNADGSAYSSAGDPRVTPIGRFLRSTSLDELPQLLNVLRGEMSLVGPRPDQPDQVRFYSEQDMLKLRLKPGLTGLAQLNGRNSIPWEVRRKLDVEYVMNYSVGLDLMILLKTVPYVVMRHGINVDPSK